MSDLSQEKIRRSQSYFRILNKVKPVELLHLGNWELKVYIYLLDITEQNTPTTEDWYWKPFNLHEVLGIGRATYHKALSELKSLGLLETQSATIISSRNGQLTFVVGTRDGNVQIPEGYKQSKLQGQEAIVRDRLQQQIGGKTEVATPIGRIDLLTDTELVEVKRAEDWKAAMGQVLAYGAFCPNHVKRLHLFGNDSLYAIQAREICESFEIVVTFEEVNHA